MKRSRDAEAETKEQTDQPAQVRRKCPYLDTVNRQLLDFDREKVCSVSLSNMNVYSCLVCGKFFQGRGKQTHAFTHSVQQGHFVFLNISNSRAYCLPDGYEIVDTSLDDVKRCLNPHFSVQDVSSIDKNSSLSRDVHGASYLPGFVGMNNLGHTDYVNATVHALAHVPPLRDFFLNSENFKSCKSKIVHRFGETVQKIWSRDKFKSTVSPQELVEQITISSKKRFGTEKQTEVIDLIAWLLNELHNGLKGCSKDGSALVHDTFQGKVYQHQHATPRHLLTGQSLPYLTLPSTFLLMLVSFPILPSYVPLGRLSLLLLPFMCIYMHDSGTTRPCSIYTHSHSIDTIFCSIDTHFFHRPGARDDTRGQCAPQLECECEWEWQSASWRRRE
jgi:hypothetical protein